VSNPEVTRSAGYLAVDDLHTGTQIRRLPF
jgi:hypothetical protein